MNKQIILRKLSLKNFKGIKKLDVDFSKITNIYGDNGTGKTSIADAFMWLLFDKDTKNRVVGEKESNFQIKTLDRNGDILHGLEHTVTGVLNIDNRDMMFSKTYKEKWTKKRGEAEKRLTGHETLYYIDEVPVKKREYQDKINSLIDENVFKLLTNPVFFSTNMSWQDRRKILIETIGDVSIERIINYNSSLKMIERLLADKDMEMLKKSIAARKKKLNEDIKSIPYRIDECNNSIKNIDFDALEFRKRSILPSIKSLEEQLIDSSKVNDEILKQKDKLYELKSKLRDIEYRATNEANKPKQELEMNKVEIERELWQLNSELEKLIDRKSFYEKQIPQLESKTDELRNKWFNLNSEILEIDENEFICPTCKRPFEVEDVEIKKHEMMENFNQNKAKKLAEIQSQGKGIKENIEKLQDDIKSFDFKIEALNSQINDKTMAKQEVEYKIRDYIETDPLLDNTEYQSLKAEIAEVEEKINQPQTMSDKAGELKSRKYALQEELEEINGQLAYEKQNIELKARISQLEEEEKKLAGQIAELEGQEFLCEEFIKTKVELLESKINSKFKYVNFKLFDIQVNGGINECCEALINGVPFSNANTASQINAGLDIINILSDHYKVSVPIFIDNRESINEILECNSQLVNLIVSNDKNLNIKNLESEVA